MRQNLYKVVADYRKNNENKPCYYIEGFNVKEVKNKFMSKLSWLKIYSIEIVEKELVDEIFLKPYEYIIIR